MKSKIMKFFSDLGRSLMMPVAALAACGIILGITSALLKTQVQDAVPFLTASVPLFIITTLNKVSGIVFTLLPVLFAISIAFGLAKEDKGVAAFAGFIGYYTFLVASSCMISTGIMDFSAMKISNILGVDTVDMGALAGIMAGLVTAKLHNKYHKVQFPAAIAFYGGKRFVALVVLVSMTVQQSGIIAFAGCVLGIVLGYIMCRAAASTDGFLRFTAKDIGTYRFVWQMLVYAVAAAVIMVLFITVPVWKKSKDAISEHSRGRISKKKPLWEKCFIDVILLALSAYLLYNYNKQKSTLAISVLENRSIDPVMILDNSIFIFAAALLCVRLTGLIILLVDRLFKKRFSPAMYASFLQLKRTRYNQGFLAVFLIMTVAGGIFDANMARTMNSNMEQRIAYNVGCDAIYNEDFRLRIQKNKDGSVSWMYDEPDFGKYESLKNEGICDGVTRVLEDERVDISAGSGSVSDAYLMAINTKEFGETAKLQSDQNDDINDAHWFNYLNELAKEPDGVIISSNLAKALGLKVGDSLNYSRYVSEAVDDDQIYASENVKVCAIVKGFPGYERYTYETDAEGNVTEQEKYLIVANYATVVEKFGMTPYSVWMNLSKGKTVDDIYKNLTSAQQLIDENKNSATVQITNGMFTLSFILSLIVCSVGFLLYWVMTLKQRELQFGIYRAMGMRMREVKAMLLNEQIFLSFLPLLAGAGIGIAATAMFVRLISIIYLPQKHNIGVNVYIYQSDMLELAGVLFVAVAVCYVVISRLLKSMKIAQALRLGEDS